MSLMLHKQHVSWGLLIHLIFFIFLITF